MFRKILEAVFLEKAFKDFSFFKKARSYLPRKNYLQLFKYVKYRKRPKFATVIRLNGTGRRFFIILKGEVTILIPRA